MADFQEAVENGETEASPGETFTGGKPDDITVVVAQVFRTDAEGRATTNLTGNDPSYPVKKLYSDADVL